MTKVGKTLLGESFKSFEGLKDSNEIIDWNVDGFQFSSLFILNSNSWHIGLHVQ